MQPVHVDDLTQVVVKLATDDATARRYAGKRVAVVGPQAMMMREFYAQLRAALGLSSPARFLNIPMWYMAVMAQAGRWVPGSPLDPDTLSMLVRGSSAAVDDTRSILGRDPRGVEAFFTEAQPTSHDQK